MEPAAGVSAAAETAEARAGELDRSALDPTAARNALDWVPAVALEDGVARVLDWFRARR